MPKLAESELVVAIAGQVAAELSSPLSCQTILHTVVPGHDDSLRAGLTKTLLSTTDVIRTESLEHAFHDYADVIVSSDGDLPALRRVRGIPITPPAALGHTPAM